jgi:hypothetical protein
MTAITPLSPLSPNTSLTIEVDNDTYLQLQDVLRCLPKDHHPFCSEVFLGMCF